MICCFKCGQEIEIDKYTGVYTDYHQTADDNIYCLKCYNERMSARCHFCNRPAEWIIDDYNYCEEHYELYHVQRKQLSDWSILLFEFVLWFLVIVMAILVGREILK